LTGGAGWGEGERMLPALTVRNKLFLGLALVAGLCGGEMKLPAQGYIIPNGVKYIGSAGYFDANAVNVIYNPNDSSYYTTFAFLPGGITTPPGGSYTNTFSFDYTADVGVRVFMVTANLAITTNALLSGSFTELHYSSSANYVFPDGSPFYLALYTGNVAFHPPSGVYDNPILGWVELVNNQGVIQMLGGATEYGGAGIYAGTLNIIQPAPEPCGLVLAGLGGAIALARAFKQRRFAGHNG
jgi:hypothetical protein